MEHSREFYDIEYEQNKRSIRDIANELKTYPNKIRRELIKMGYKMRTKSEAQTNSIAAGRNTHPTKGKKRPEELKIRISENVAKSWEGIDEEERSKRVKSAQQQWKNMSFEEKALFRKAGAEAVRETTKTGSKLERFLRDSLIELGHEVEFHRDALIPNEKLQIDLFLPALKIAIEIDGPSHFLPIWGDGPLIKTMEADRKKNSLLITHGYVVLRVRNVMKTISEINKRDLLQNVVDKIERIEANFPDLHNRIITIDLK